jgi:hypothetical protein
VGRRPSTFPLKVRAKRRDTVDSMFRAHAKPATPTQQGLVIGVAFFVAYLLTRTRDLVGDPTIFAVAVDSFLGGRGIRHEFFHPHHPLFNPLVAAVTWLVRLLGFHPFIVDVGAGVAAFFAATVVAALVPLLRRADVGEGPALLAAAVAGASGGLWQFATCMEVYGLTAAAVLLWLAVVGQQRPRALPSAVSLAVATLAHLASGLLVLPTALRLRKRTGAMAVAIGVGLGLAATALITIFMLFHHAYTPGQWLHLVIPGYADAYLGRMTRGPWLQTLVDLALWGWYHGVPVFSPTTAHWLDIAGAFAVAVLLLLLGAGVLAAVRDHHPLALTAALGIAAYVPLWLIWDVGNVEHAVATVPLFATLIAFGAARLPRRRGQIALATALALLLLVNGLASAVPQSRPENGREWVIASFVAANVPKDAVVLSVGVDPRLRLSLPYLSGRRVVMLTLDVLSARAQGRSPLQALDYWMGVGKTAPSVWVTPDVLDPSSLAWVERLGIPAGIWSAIISAGRPVHRRVLKPDGVVIRQPFVLTELIVAPNRDVAPRPPE